MQKIINIWTQITDWLAPRYCCLCAKLLSVETALCANCEIKLPWNLRTCVRCALPIESGQQCGACLKNAPVFIRCISPFRYEPPISTFIIQLKFQHQLRYAKILGQLLADNIYHRDEPLPECLIPVPLHYKRLQQRGFNQAVEIAKPLSKRFKLPLLYDHYYRHKNTLPQSGLPAHARRSNLRAAFGLRRKSPYSHVAIIDDVMTTGQTVQAFSEMLQQQGVQTIEVWCCARVG
jgi:ComF family protein